MRKARARDGMSRAEYEARAAERRATAQRLQSQGLTVQAIADHLGVSDERVRQLLKRSLDRRSTSIPTPSHSGTRPASS
jgi:DNA-directed RNA polymerase sigma subunit (sigma70/sigma32)